MRRFIFIFTFLIGFQSFLYSQELQNLSYENSDLYLSGISLSENWKTELVYNTILVTNGNIKNKSNKNYRGLILKLYLIPVGTSFDSGSFNGYRMTEANFKVLDSNSSLVGIKIQSEVNQTPPNGIYNPVLIMTNISGKIMSMRVLDDAVKSEDGVLFVTEAPAKIETDSETNIAELASEKTEATKSTSETQQKINLNPDSVVKITVADDHSITLDQQWQVEILPKDFLVNIKGGDISNLTDKDVENLTLDVFLTDEIMDVVDNDFSGIRIASANIGEIGSFKKFSGTQVKASMINIPRSGTYHILLTISATDENGEQVVRSGKYFERPVSF